MLCTARSQSELIEYSTLYGVKPAGASIGVHGGRDIAASVVDAFGRRFVYVGLAPRKPNGQLDAHALKKGEFFLMPGLLYRFVPSHR